MNKKYILFCLMAMVMTLFASCGAIDDALNGDDDEPDVPVEETVVNGQMQKSELVGFVTDTDGQPLQGVIVTSGTARTVTNEAGGFNLGELDINGGRSIVKFSSDNYFTVVRSAESFDADNWNVVLCPRFNYNSYTVSTTFSASTAQVLTADLMTVDLSGATGYTNVRNGKTFTGTVKAEMMYLSPENEHFTDMMPGGDLAALREDGSRAQLKSYGMVSVGLYDSNGERLQLKDGSSAKLTFPVPESMKGGDLPASIPLWSFNESTGLWEEEGAAEKMGDVYEGTVKHFSWVNLDWPEEQATIHGYVKNDRGNVIPGVKVLINKQASVRTNDKGYYTATVMANTRFTLKVDPKSYGNCKNVPVLDVHPLQPKSDNKMEDIVLPYMPKISGAVVNDAGGSPMASLWIEYRGEKTSKVYSTAEGNFAMYVPEDYRGSATLVALTSDNKRFEREIELDGEDHFYTINISSTAGSGGILTATLDGGGSLTFNIVDAGPEELGGVVLNGENLMVMQDSEDEGSGDEFYFVQKGYKESGTSYENGMMDVSNSRGNNFQSTTVKSEIVKKDGKFVFNFSGQGVVDDETRASIYGTGVTLSLLMKGETVHNVTPAEAGLPDFAPALSAKSPAIYVIKESEKMGKGGMICYNGNMTEYENLKAQAANNGLKLVDEETYDDYSSVTYSTGNKLVTIDYTKDAKNINDSYDPLFGDEAPITVTVLDGFTLSISDMFGAPSPSKTKVMKRVIRAATK